MADDRVEHREYQRNPRAQGLILALFGIVIMTSPIFSASWSALVFSVPFGGLTVVTALWMLFGAVGWTLDRGSRELKTWWTLLGYRKETGKARLLNFDKLCLCRRERYNSRYHRNVPYFSLELQGDDGVFVVAKSDERAPLRPQARLLAKSLRLGLHDRSLGEPAYYSQTDLHLSLLDRYRLSSEPVEMPSILESAKASRRVDGGLLTFELPFSGRIEASAQGVTFRRSSVTESIPLEELDEIEIDDVNFAGIVIISDARTIHVRYLESPEELAWIRDSLHAHVALLAHQD